MNRYPNPLLISRGAALVEFNGGFFFSKGDITLEWGVSQTPIKSSFYGDGNLITTKIAPSLKIPLDGQIAYLATLFPYGSYPVGTSIFIDDPVLSITPLDTTQSKITFYQAAITKEPDLTLGSKAVAFGDVTFRFRPVPGVPLTDSAAWFTEAENDYDGAEFAASAIIAQAYAGSWLSQGTSTLTFGADTTASFTYDATAADVAAALNELASMDAIGACTVTGGFQCGFTVTFGADDTVGDITGTVTDMPPGTGWQQTIIQQGSGTQPQIVLLELTPWAQFSTEDDIKIAFSTKITEAPSSQTGFYDLIFGGTTVKATALPLNIDQTLALAAANIQGASAGLGSAPNAASANDLSIFAEGLYVILYNATLKPTTLIRSSEKQLVGAMEWNTGLTVSGSGVGQKYYVGASAPE